MDQYFLNLGLPQIVLTNNGPCFTSKLNSCLDSKGVKLIHTTPYHPLTKPVSRLHQEMNRFWCVLCKGRHPNWVKHFEVN